MNISKFIKKHLTAIILAILGGIAGFAYWYFIGCLTGSCSITSVWYNSTAYGLVMGSLAGMVIRDYTRPNKNANAEQ